MDVELSVVTYAASTYYNILVDEASITKLVGYDDKNFLVVDTTDNQKYVIKIVNPDNTQPCLTGEYHKMSYFPDRSP